jgi:hypothetical protein
MIVPDISLEEWLKEYPALFQLIPVRCLCGKESKLERPYLTRDFAGIEAARCDCGRPGATISVTRNPKAAEKWTQLVSQW